MNLGRHLILLVFAVVIGVNIVSAGEVGDALAGENWSDAHKAINDGSLSSIRDYYTYQVSYASSPARFMPPGGWQFLIGRIPEGDMSYFRITWSGFQGYHRAENTFQKAREMQKMLYETYLDPI